MGTDEINFKVNADAAKAALGSLNASLKSTGSSIDGVKNTLEKVFAAQAILASAGRVKDAIDSVTASMEAQTGALQQVIHANKNASSSMDELAAASKRATDAAGDTDATIGKFEPFVKLAETLSSYSFGPLSSVYKAAAGAARDALDGQKDISDALKREAAQADDLLKKRKEGEAFFERERRERAALGRQQEDQAKKRAEEAKKRAEEAEKRAEEAKAEQEAQEKIKENEDNLTASILKGLEAIRARRAEAQAAMDAGFQNAMAEQSSTTASRSKGNPSFEEVATELDLEKLAADRARTESEINALANTRKGQRIGGAREARRALELSARADAADAVGSHYDAERLRERAEKAEGRAAERLDRNEARSKRQEARAAERRGEFDSAKRLNKEAAELDKAGTQRVTGGVSGKSVTDVWTILNNRLPAQS